MGYDCRKRLPVFPDTVIMFRNMAWKFPCRRIIRIGFEHGAYNFKKHSKAQYYNMFNVYFMTSQYDVERVRSKGVKTCVAVGFPKIDTVFDGTITQEYLDQLVMKLGFSKDKKTLLFSSTWDGSGMSAIDKWYDKLDLLKDKYNLMVTVHEWMSDKYKKALQDNPNVYFIKEWNITEYIMLADVCINDYSSLIAEFCLLNKPVITFKFRENERTLPDVIKLIEKVSFRIDSFEELEPAICMLIDNPDMLAKERQEVIKVFFDTPDGLAGQRAAEKIVELVPELINHRDTEK
jgi:CDP-glycerol glycerophosphotransferase (TagB/SpsB family)